MPGVTPAEAATELLRRRTARKSLIAFTEYTAPYYEAAPHHKEIAAHLERVEQGACQRLMIIEPPRHGKSELASRRFPAYYIGRNPQHGIVAASYNSDLAMDFGREVRNIVRSQPYQMLFPGAEMAVDSKAADRWHISEGGSYAAAGVGTAVTGRDADIFLIDDPMKDREDANSERMRERLWSWYSSVVQSRLPRAIVLIQTRWHEDDLAGRLLANMEDGGEQWTVLHHPAIASDNKALWPDRYPLDKLEQVRSTMLPRDWSALFQGTPAPEEGDFFKADWFRWYDTPPAILNKYGASDYAITEADGDWTCHGVAGVDANDDLYLLDWYREQVDTYDGVETAITLMKNHNPMAWAEEKAQIEKALGPFIAKRQRERKVYTFRVQLSARQNKMAKAQAFRARAAQGKVYLPKGAPWVADFLAELLMFPSGKHDDQVDVAGLFGRILDEMVSAHIPTAKQDPDRPLTFNELIAQNDTELQAKRRQGRHGL